MCLTNQPLAGYKLEENGNAKFLGDVEIGGNCNIGGNFTVRALEAGSNFILTKLYSKWTRLYPPNYSDYYYSFLLKAE